MRGEKRVLSNVFILAAVTLAILPFLTSSTDLLTQLLMKFEFYRFLQNLIVPYEMNLLKTTLGLLGFLGLDHFRYGKTYVEVVRNNHWEAVYLSWNCVGWQSVVLFLSTLFAGLTGSHTRLSKLETVLIGVLGVFFVNVVRLTSVVLVYQVFGRLVGIIYHDYVTTLFTIGFLFVFWWFSYSFLLEEKP